MRSFEEFERSYLKERHEHVEGNFFTLFGFFYRLIGSEKYWLRFIERETSIARYGVSWLSELLRVKSVTEVQLNDYRLALQNTNSKISERSNFILIFVSAVSVLGLSSLNTVFSDHFHDPPKVFLVAISIIILGVLIERIRGQFRIAIHEELINVIDRCI
ncbi:hypothetical protein Q9252_06030 [Marinobacter salarius]|uniref:hypothetical protein n=1 Tax=Marinobacter salarius TaxID=1420917 RepID=UPI00273AE9F4|nr:hypothetical protein [Marinobacter salarius]MDP4531695.1 hypothetical protein [Marinobacter salarius]